MQKGNCFIAKYDSSDNFWSGEIVLQAECLKEAQNMFLEWLKNQPVYSHLWQLSFSIRLSSFVRKD